MANAPAVAVSSRVSPIDDLNLNRVFPGDNLGTPTQAIAAAIEEILLPVCDYAFDIHSMLRQGVVGVSAEFGGAGGLSNKALRQCECSLRRFLAHIGALPQEATEQRPAHPFRLYNVASRRAQAYAEHSGLLELAVTIGADVAVGDLLGRIHNLHDPLREPEPVLASLAGRILCLRALPRIEIGDCIAQIGQEQRP